jgi:DUF309 family protein family protein
MTAHDLRTGFEHGRRLFNQRRYFDAHEVWEDVWRELKGEQKRRLQGLIQVAVALHHFTQQNARGAASLLARAEPKLAADSAFPFDAAAARSAVAQWRTFLTEHGPQPPWPKI